MAFADAQDSDVVLGFGVGFRLQGSYARQSVDSLRGFCLTLLER